MSDERTRAVESFDVAVVGGGPAGAVAARVLARRGLRTVVLEAAAGPRAKPGETLPPSAWPLLRKLGLDDVLARDGHLPAHGVRARWGAAEPGENPFLASPWGAGWHVDRAKLEARLAQAAVAAGAQWRWGWKVASCRRRGDGWRLRVESDAGKGGEGGEGGAIEARFVADATGRHARIARRLARQIGGRRVRYDRLVGLFACLPPAAGRATGEPPEDSFTVVEAVEDGWWYSAPLAGGGLAVCRFGDGDLLASDLLRGDPAAWRRALAETVETRERVAARSGAAGEVGEVGAAGEVGAIRALPADSSRLDTIDGDGWIALGDAAAAYDPLSSHGIASALGSGYYGGHAIAERLTGQLEAAEAAATARLAYRSVLETTYAAYLDLLRTHYAKEHRWPTSPFWHRRHATTFARVA